MDTEYYTTARCKHKRLADQCLQCEVESEKRLFNGYTASNPPTDIPLKERIRMAKEHMRHYPSHGCIFPYQHFAMSIAELLDAAERGA